MQNVWLVDATTYTKDLDPLLRKSKIEYFQLKSHARKILLNDEASSVIPRAGYSIGLLRIAAILRSLSWPKCEVKYMPLREAIGRIARIEGKIGKVPGFPDIVGFGAVTPTLMACADLSNRIHRISPRTVTAVGGAHVRMAPKLTRQLIDSDGKQVFTKVIDTSDKLAVSQLLDISVTSIADPRYFIEYNQVDLPRSCANLFYGSGCSFSCNYCQDNQSQYAKLDDDVFKAWFQLTLDTIRERWSDRKHYPVHFCDSELGGSASGALSVCNLISTNFPNHNLLLSCDLRAEIVNESPEELVAALAAAGFREIRLGIDTVVADVLKGLNRSLNIDAIQNAIASIRQKESSIIKQEKNLGSGTQRMYVSVYIVTGLPGSTPETDVRTQRFVLELLEKREIDEVKHHIYVPYPTDQTLTAKYAISGDVKLLDNSPENWVNYDRQSKPVYELPNYTNPAIWNQFLSTESAINAAWKKAWKLGDLNLPESKYSEYNVGCYLQEVAPTNPKTKAKTQINIAYLSDLHMANTRGDCMADVKVQLERLQVETYSDQLKRTLLSLGPDALDYLVVGGDVTFQGLDTGFAEFDWLVREIMDHGVLKDDARRVVLAPGNHDLNDASRFQTFESVFKNKYPHAFLSEQEPLLFDSEEALYVKLLAAWNEEDKLFGGLIERTSLPFVLDLEAKTVLYAFNSAMIARSRIAMSQGVKDIVKSLTPKEAGLLEREYEVDPAAVVVRELEFFRKAFGACERLVREKLRDVDWADFLKIAVLHHPIAAISPYTEVKQFGYLTNCGEFKKALSEYGFHLVLHGHYHWPEVYQESAISGGGNFIVVSGGSICDETPPGNRRGRGFYLIKYYGDKGALNFSYMGLPGGVPKEEDGYGEKIVFSSRAIADRKRFKMLAANAAKTLLLEKLSRDSQGNFGWPHNLKDFSVETVGTAYGLMIMELANCSGVLAAEVKKGALKTLSDRRITERDKGWGVSKPEGGLRRIGRPDVTAWVAEAFRGGGEPEILVTAIEDLITLVTDRVGWKDVRQSTYMLALAVRVIARLRPDYVGFKELAEGLLSIRGRVGSPNASGCWPSGIRKGHSKEASVAHTAHAMVALIEAWQATNGRVGLSPTDLNKEAMWLVEQPKWAPQTETLPYRSSFCGRNTGDLTTVWHYTGAWATMACLEAGISPMHKRIVGSIREIMEEQIAEDAGIWDLVEGGTVIKEQPIWATLDALKTLALYELTLKKHSAKTDQGTGGYEEGRGAP